MLNNLHFHQLLFHHIIYSDNKNMKLHHSCICHDLNIKQKNCP